MEILFMTLIAALLVWQVLLLAPMVPGKLVDTRDFSSLARWKYNGFNIFLTSLSVSSLTVAGFAIIGRPWSIEVSLVLAILYMLVFASDLFEIFPVVEDKIPVQLLVLEVISLSSAGVLAVVCLAALRQL